MRSRPEQNLLSVHLLDLCVDRMEQMWSDKLFAGLPKKFVEAQNFKVRSKFIVDGTPVVVFPRVTQHNLKNIILTDLQFTQLHTILSSCPSPPSIEEIRRSEDLQFFVKGVHVRGVPRWASGGVGRRAYTKSSNLYSWFAGIQV